MRIAFGVFSVVLGLFVLVLVADFATVSLFYATLGKVAPGYRPIASIGVWNSYGVDPVYASRLWKIQAGLLFVVGIGVSLALLLRSRLSNLHGAARFATSSELDQKNLFAVKGILFGRVGSRYLCLPGERHLLVVAPTRSGKSQGVAIPNLLNWPDSLVVLDVKLELFARTSGFRANSGQEVFLFNPFAEDFRTHRWNPLDAVRCGDRRAGVYTVTDLGAIASVLYPTKGGDQTAEFFANQAQNLFIAVALYVLETPPLPFTLGQVGRTGVGLDDGGLPELFRQALSQRHDLSADCKDAMKQFLGTSGDTLSSIKATFDAPLLIFRNPLIDAATSASDFRLADARRRRMTVYLGVSPRYMEQASVLLTVFVSQALYANLDALPARADQPDSGDPSLRYQLMLLLDEFRVLGKMSQLVDSAGYLAGYGIRLVTILQSLGQLGIYGKDTAESFMANHGAKLVFAPREERDAKEISEALGTFTEMSESYSRSGRGGSFLKGDSGMSVGINVSAQRRALLLPQEVKAMPFEDEIAFVEDVRPIRGRKIMAFKDPVFQRRSFPPVMIAQLDVRAREEPKSQAAEVSADRAGGQAVSLRDTAAAASMAAVDTDLLDRRLNALTMDSADPNNPTEGEVQRYVSRFMNELEEMGAWKL